MEQLVNKLSAKEIMGDIVALVKTINVGERVDAYALAGRCDAYETGVSTFGEWNRFIGIFQAVNYQTGESFRAPKAHIPPVLENLLLAGIAEKAAVNTKKSTKNGQFYDLDAPVEFSFICRVTRVADDEKGGIQYKYSVEPIIPLEQKGDVIGHLVSALPKLGVTRDHLTEVTDPEAGETNEPKPKAKK